MPEPRDLMRITQSPIFGAWSPIMSGNMVQYYTTLTGTNIAVSGINI